MKQQAMQVEWHTILRSGAMGNEVCHLVESATRGGATTLDVPSHEWLYQVLQLVKFDLDAHIAADRAHNQAFCQCS